MKKLVVVPSDPISAYEAKGTSSWLEEYYNPDKYFDEVYVLSPRENEYRNIYGLNIIPVKSNTDYKSKLKKINPLCVRAYGGYWATDYAVYNKVNGIPVVSSVHDTNLDLIHSSLRFSDKIITMSNVIKNILLKNKYGIAEDIFVLGNRVDLNVFHYKNKSNDELINIRKNFPKGNMILHVGRVSEEKNIKTVIESLKYLEDCYLVHIGQGDFSELQVLVDKLSLRDRVFNISKIENNELINWYNAADVICVPSKREGFGVVFIEAAACKAKIVTSDIAPMNEFLMNDKEMNYLVKDFENPTKVSEAIIELLENNKYNDNTLKFISNKFSKHVVANKEVKQYKSVLDKNREKTHEYIQWKLCFILKKNTDNILKKIFKLFRRIWKRILSYL